MRKPVYILFIAAAFMTAAVIALAGCATADKRVAFGESPIAIVSIVSNRDINWKDESPVDPSKAIRAVRRNMEENPDVNIATLASDFIEEIEQLIRNSLETSPFITFVPRGSVLSSRSYLDADPYSYHVKEQLVKPTGYRYINYRDKNFLRDFAAETGIKKTLFISLDLTKNMSMGIGKTGNFRASVTMTVMLKDEKGKTLFNKVYTQLSPDQAKVSIGQYSHADLRQLMLSAIGEVCYHLMDDIAY